MVLKIRMKGLRVNSYIAPPLLLGLLSTGGQGFFGPCLCMHPVQRPAVQTQPSTTHHPTHLHAQITSLWGLARSANT